MKKRTLLTIVAGAVAMVALAFTSFAASSYDEGADGDLANDGMVPTTLAFSAGTNSVSGSTGGGDRDYFTVDIPARHQMTAITLTTYTGSSVSFVAVITGSQTAISPTNANPADLLGFHLFGGADLNTDILPAMGIEPSSAGFTPPLPAGSYTFWIQELGAVIDYAFDFELEKTPADLDEDVAGDFSGDRLNPTVANLSVGDNTIAGNTGPGDLDFVTFSIPNGHQLSQIVLNEYNGAGGIKSFIGLVPGNQMTVDPTVIQESDMLGYHLFEVDDVGNDILGEMGTAFGAQGFTPPLPAGKYTLWIQETAPPFVDYEFNLVFERVTSTYAESVDGDLANSGLTPSSLTLNLGNNVISGTTQTGDRDYVTIYVPPGSWLNKIELNSYTGVSKSFIGFVDGQVMSVDPENADPADLRGYHLFSSSDVGTDVLDDISTAAGTSGFTPPLSPGYYTFWIQEVAAAVDYEFNFIVDSKSVDYAEATDGDLSDDGLFPTALETGFGDTELTAQVTGGTIPDRDYVFFMVEKDSWVTSILLKSFIPSSEGETITLRFVRGGIIEDPPGSPNPVNYEAVIEISASDVGKNLVIDFPAPIGVRTSDDSDQIQYTLWIEPGNSGMVDYSMVFTTETLSNRLYLPVIFKE